VSSRFVILAPCSKSWSDLTGEGRRRFCSECQTHIHALEQYSDAEIEDLRRESGGHLCGYMAGESLPPPRSRRAVLMGALLTAISPLMAQSGRVRVRVMDAAGAVIPGAEVLLSGVLVGRADQRGEIVLMGLPIGESQLTVTRSGFKNLPLVITIRNADELNVDAKMEVGPFMMGLFVEARQPQVSTEPPPEDLNTILPPPKMVAVPPPPIEPPSQVSSPKKNRKRWRIFR